MRKLTASFPSLLAGIALSTGLYFVGASTFGDQLPPVLLWLLGAGLVTFGYYGWDKARSKGDRRRIPEWTLHGLALLGGVGGGWLGMFAFRHKTRKVHFRWILAGATLLWAWLLLQ